LLPKVILRLNVDPFHKPVIQKRRHLGTEKSATVAVEVKKLLEAGFIRECHYPRWVSNIVLVKKHNGTWRMCVDFTNLTRHARKAVTLFPRLIN